MKKPLLILIALCISVIGYSQAVGDTFVDDFITYEITSISPYEVETTGYNSAGGTVVNIPAATTNNLITYAVTATGFNSFNGKGLTAVTFPNSIISIGQQSFPNNSLTSVAFPNSVVTIGPSAFKTNNLTHVTIPNTVTDIGFAAFRDNPLATVTSQGTTPATIFTPGINDSFWNRHLIDLTIPSGTASAYVAGGWTGFNSVTEVAPLTIGDTFTVDFITYEVTSIAPDTVKAIDYDMAGGTIVDIPAFVSYSIGNYDVIVIGAQAFSGKGLTAVTIPFGVETIHYSAFSNNQLTSVIIPDSVTNMYNSIFYINQLTSVTLSNNLISIGSLAFAVNELTSITIPNSVTFIADGAFYVNNLTNIVLSNSITDIAVDAFRDNNLTNIIIPASVTTIGNNVFRDNPLTSVTSLAITPPSITTSNTGFADTFANDRSTIALHILPGAMGAYVTDSGALWTGFNPATEDATLSTSNFELANDVKIITAFDNIKIVYSNSLRLENYTVYTISGAKITTGNKTEIPTSFLASGIYIIKLDFDAGTVIKKLLIN